MAMKHAKDYYGLELGIDTTISCRPRRLVSQITVLSCRPNKAVWGERVCARFRIHQDGVLKARDTFEIMRAEDVAGRPTRSCSASLVRPQCVQAALEDLGVTLESETDVNAGVRALQGLAGS